MGKQACCFHPQWEWLLAVATVGEISHKKLYVGASKTFFADISVTGGIWTQVDLLVTKAITRRFLMQQPLSPSDSQQPLGQHIKGGYDEFSSVMINNNPRLKKTYHNLYVR